MWPGLQKQGMWSLGPHNFLFQYGMATKFSRFVDNLFGFNKLLTESKYYISVLRYVESNNMVCFSPHALFSKAWSHILSILRSIYTQLLQSYILNIFVFKEI